VDIAVSGLRAQAKRMNVISNNIANASTTRTDSGQPYRRQDVVLLSGGGEIGGVRIGTVAADTTSDFKRVRMPGHPDADEEGWVMMPNVSLPREMMDLIVASRAYQANAAVLKRYQDAVNVTLELLR
jgi:flagellar basal-body rod protein FlgC